MKDVYLRRVHKVAQIEERAKLMELYSRTDALTGLNNRRDFDETTAREWKRAEREQTSVGLVMLDIDHFKSVNDVHGHAVGDQVLCEVARRLDGALMRGVDYCARLGGEEFVVLLPGSDIQQALRTAERLIAAIRSQTVEVEGGHLMVTCSAGVAAEIPVSGFDLEALLERADMGLYKAKREGRNCVRMVEL